MNVPTPPPDSPDWPCKTWTPRRPGGLPGRLVCALYLLLRDEVLPGDMENVLLKAGSAKDDKITYTNPHLEALARAHAAWLLQGESGQRAELAPGIRSDGELLAYIGVNAERWVQEFALHLTALAEGDSKKLVDALDPSPGGWLFGWFANALGAGETYGERKWNHVRQLVLLGGDLHIVHDEADDWSLRLDGNPPVYGATLDEAVEKLMEQG